MNTVRKVLFAGSQIIVVSGEYFGREGRVDKMIGGPHEKQTLTVSLQGVAGKVELFQHQVKVLKSPEGWQPGMKPVYHAYPEPEPIKEPDPVATVKPKEVSKPPKPKGPSGNRKSRRKKGHQRSPQYVGDVLIPNVSGRGANTRRQAH